MAFFSGYGIGVTMFCISSFGLIGNCLVIFVLLRQWQKWTIPLSYVFNLAVADAALMLAIPFWGHFYIKSGVWESGLVMCKIAFSIGAESMTASILFVVAMSIDRLVAVVRPFKLDRFRTRKVTLLVFAVIWSITLGIFVYLLVETTTVEQFPSAFNYSCNFLNEQPTHQPGSDQSTAAPMNASQSSATALITVNTLGCSFGTYSAFHNTNIANLKIRGQNHLLSFIGAFLIPLVVVSACYITILVHVKQKTIGKTKRLGKVTKLSAAIIITFFVGWLPMQVLNLYSFLSTNLQLLPYCGQYFDLLNGISLCLAWSTSCINPFLYGFLRSDFQKTTCEIFRKLFRFSNHKVAQEGTHSENT
ncbi:unnamed protein product [Clavelina lepadiformis]|uniref:G-protein coupled receptors family 1 profile domain-containing protein n=1 Tax=Clavelina lepadiformis TaxID=159417 RepID=A0ABP0FNV6_CLALP